MAYISLYNKYRPRSLADVVGQEVTIQTIANAIETDNLTSTIILSGSYGIGKTSIARIIAKSLNCFQGPTIEPCDRCVACIDVSNGDLSNDILELDAASNNGVDDIRTILESAKYRPSNYKYRVYIIDEAHMLSKGAFNALLKAFENSYEHVKFIMATTELDKIPATIISRAQSFVLNRISVIDQIQYMNNIALKENMNFTRDVLQLISEVSNGSMRDAISIMEQANIYSLGNNTLDNIRKMLGYSNLAQYDKLVELILKGKADESLSLFGVLYMGGDSINNILHHILDSLYSKTISYYTKSKNINYDYQESCIRVWQKLSKSLKLIFNAPNPHQASEMILLQLCVVATLPSPQKIITNNLMIHNDDNGNKCESLLKKKEININDDITNIVLDTDSNLVREESTKIKKNELRSYISSILYTADVDCLTNLRCFHIDDDNNFTILAPNFSVYSKEKSLLSIKKLFNIQSVVYNDIRFISYEDIDGSFAEVIKSYYPNAKFRQADNITISRYYDE